MKRSAATITPTVWAKLLAPLLAAQAEFAARGWLMGTSGNLSLRISKDPLQFLVTASGVDKATPSADQYVLVDEMGQGHADPSRKPSFEAPVHAALYAATGAGCVLHVHTPFNNVVTARARADEAIVLRGHEMIKGLGMWEEDAEIRLPVAPNFTDISKLATVVAAAVSPRTPAVLVRRHGIYVWGESVGVAKRHLECLEFMFQVEVLESTYGGR